MSIYKTAFVALALSLFLYGCGNDNASTETVHTSSWWASHDSARTAKLKECHDNPGQLENTPNCVNAIDADTRLDGDKPWPKLHTVSAYSKEEEKKIKDRAKEKGMK